MKLKYSSFIIICLALLNISCKNNRYENIKQPAPDTSEEQVKVKKVDSVETASMDNSQISAPKINYEFPDDNGIGPVKSVELGPINSKFVQQGKMIFNAKCAACHQLDTKLIGPPLRNITKKNTPVFIMNYLLNTTEMQTKDPLLKKLVEEYKIIMPDQQLNNQDARSLLEYFRSIEK